MSAQRTLRRAAIAEGVSLLALLLIAMPLKYALGLPVAVTIAGGLHGVLFLWFCWALFGAFLELQLPARRVLRLLLAAVIPFGFLSIARELGGRSDAAPLARGSSALLLLLSGCAHLGNDYRSCDSVPEAQLARLPARLSETGLYADASLAELSPGVQAYQPRFELWSDGAHKRRWVQLPPGVPIDSSDPDAWQFPQGTRFWKEFSLGGTRLETRLLEKIGPNPADWAAAAYVWSADGSDAALAPEGSSDVHGTAHDVPAASNCFGCHGGTRSRVLGFSAVQLGSVEHSSVQLGSVEHSPVQLGAAQLDATPASDDEVTLASLSASGALTHPLPEPLTLPGDEPTQQALGYLHANCSHCHNQRRPEPTGARCFDPQKDFDLSLRTNSLASVRDTAAYQTTIDGVVVPGAPEHSELYRRMQSGSIFLRRMPPLANEQLNRAALDLIASWIAELPRR